MSQYQNKILLALAILIAAGAGIVAIQQIEKRRAIATDLNNLKTLIHTMQSTSDESEAVLLKAENEQLNAEIMQLRKELQSAKEQLITYQQDAEPAAIQPPETESYTDRMARLKKEEPEEYQRIIDDRLTWQQNTQYSLAQRTLMFMEMDTSYMNDTELDNHNAFVDALASMFETSRSFNNPDSQPNRRQMREVWQQVREAQPIVDQQRKTIFTSTFRQELNMSDTEAEDFYNNLKNIMDVTTIAPRP